MLIYNRFSSELNFQWDTSFITQLNGPTSYTSAKHILYTQISVYALKTVESLFTFVVLVSSNQHWTNSSSLELLWGWKQTRIADAKNSKWRWESGCEAFIPSTACTVRGAVGKKRRNEQATCPSWWSVPWLHICNYWRGWVHFWLNLSSYTSLKTT